MRRCIPAPVVSVAAALCLWLGPASAGLRAGEAVRQPPVIPIGLDAYRRWDRWPYQRIGARAYMRSTYDRSGGNETADASHFLYQVAEDFNVTLDVEGAGILYFVRTNHWHGSPWHYEVDGADHIVQETTAAGDAVLAEPASYAEFEFTADAGTTYSIWVRGSTAGGNLTDATWFQFDEHIGTETLGATYASEKGFGNWRDLSDANEWSWSSSLPRSKPQTVTFSRGGRHRLRVQVRHGPHRIDQIWLSATQQERPRPAEPAGGVRDAAGHEEIVLGAADAAKLVGGFAVVDNPGASTGKALAVPARDEAGTSIEVYPAHREIGRTTTSFSEFTLRLRPDNIGALLRRTLDYSFPNQRAVVSVADPRGAWQRAGVWYLAGSNTCYHSYPREGGELGRTNPVVQTSNRRFRDDEFLVPRHLTEGRPEVRIRVEFTAVRIPLLPDRPAAEPAWSEIRYQAYSYVMPEFRGR